MFTPVATDDKHEVRDSHRWRAGVSFLALVQPFGIATGEVVATASGSDGALLDAPCGVDGSARVGLLGMPGPRLPCNSRGPCAVREFALVLSSYLQ